ncbi:MAG: DUF447 domain-containing protein [Phycisphaeraceae bacterium]
MRMKLGEGERVIEGLMTTLDEPGRVNLAPMGPIVDANWQRFVLRPFKTAVTYRNLKATGQGVFHVTDDVLLIARAAIGQVDVGDGVPTQAAQHVRGVVLGGACRYYELAVTELDDRQERTTITMQAVHAERLRDYLGLNRAKHAVIEAAILATRLHLTGAAPVLAEYEKLQTLVDKTGAAAEHEAMAMLRKLVNQWTGG